MGSKLNTRVKSRARGHRGCKPEKALGEEASFSVDKFHKHNVVKQSQSAFYMISLSS